MSIMGSQITGHCTVYSAACCNEENIKTLQCWPWASYQIRKIAGCACAGNAGNVFPRRRFQRKQLVSDPDMHHGTCVTHVPWCMSGSLACGNGENVPGIPGACAPGILRIWQEAHCEAGGRVVWVGCHFPGDIFKCIFLNENVWISIKISLFVLKGPINNIPALVQIMPLRQPGAKPLSEPMVVNLLTGVTRPQWVNDSMISLTVVCFQTVFH